MSPPIPLVRGELAEAALGEWPEAPPGERGGATLVGLALVGVLLMVGVVAIDVGALAGARAAAQTAADMAALAALTPSDAGDGGGSVAAEEWAESRAAEIARANGAELVRCDCSSVQAVGTVRRWLWLVPGGMRVAVSASSRAMLGGPPAASRATVQAVDLLRAVDGDLARRLRGATEGETVGRPAGQRERGHGGGAVRGVGGGGPGRCPRRAAGQPRGPPVRAGWAAAGGDPAGGGAEVSADPVGPAAAVRAARARAVRVVPTDLQH